LPNHSVPPLARARHPRFAIGPRRPFLGALVHCGHGMRIRLGAIGSRRALETIICLMRSTTQGRFGCRASLATLGLEFDSGTSLRARPAINLRGTDQPSHRAGRSARGLSTSVCPVAPIWVPSGGSPPKALAATAPLRRTSYTHGARRSGPSEIAVAKVDGVERPAGARRGGRSLHDVLAEIHRDPREDHAGPSNGTASESAYCSLALA
jgi:hypothetical protein